MGSSLQLQDGKHFLSKPKEVATKFNKFFANIGEKVVKQLRPLASTTWKKYEPEKQLDDTELWELQRVEQETVEKILRSMRANKSAGLDEIAGRLLKDAAKELVPSITYLVNKSLADGAVPILWKMARVTSPMINFKSELPSNFRATCCEQSY